jgi:DNA-directed RNA polymerase II subunit RPB4
MAAPAPTSRKREPIQGDEEAGAELKLGEFQDVDALTHSEAALVINALVAKRKMDRKNVNDTEYVTRVRECDVSVAGLRFVRCAEDKDWGVVEGRVM